MTGQTQTYFLYYIDESMPIPFYVGESFDPQLRCTNTVETLLTPPIPRRPTPS